MSSIKDTFEPDTFESNTFASGTWRGTGADVDVLAGMVTARNIETISIEDKTPVQTMLYKSTLSVVDLTKQVEQ
jgi:hypothetical protein|tara:strand:+ start:214 stop:435 length:222 start_codon:yes stop_codon:yes gene_type:complete